jgi:hypothetical protein
LCLWPWESANTAIFSLIDTVILRMMPVHEPERLVQFGRDLSYPLFRQYSQELRGSTDMFAQSSMGRRDGHLRRGTGGGNPTDALRFE